MLHYLIDGYNLLFALPAFPAGTWEEKRRTLLEWLIKRQPYGRNHATVVFDSREGLGDHHHYDQIEVIYTAGETADDWIIRKTRQSSNARTLVVVSDDQGIRAMIRGTGARWEKASDFVASAVRKNRQPSAKDSTRWDAITEELKKNYGL
jgi:predicted RNA-binding protein with PIN domain